MTAQLGHVVDAAAAVPFAAETTAPLAERIVPAAGVPEAFCQVAAAAVAKFAPAVQKAAELAAAAPDAMVADPPRLSPSVALSS